MKGGQLENLLMNFKSYVKKGFSNVDNSWVRFTSILRKTKAGKGNFGVGTATVEESIDIGKAWVGNGYKVAS